MSQGKEGDAQVFVWIPIHQEIHSTKTYNLPSGSRMTAHELQLSALSIPIVTSATATAASDRANPISFTPAPHDLNQLDTFQLHGVHLVWGSRKAEKWLGCT